MVIKLLKRIHGLLLKLGKVMGRVNTFVLLVLSFYLLLLPLSLLRRVFVRSRDDRGDWHRRDPLPNDHFHKQY